MERNISNGIAYYTINELGVGSGGVEYELKAARSTAGGGWIVLSQISQVEGDEPEFAMGWSILERARLP